MKNKIIIILALLVGLTAAGGIYLFLDNMKKTYQVQGDFVPVVVAKQRIPAKSTVNDQMVEIRELPSKYLIDQAAVDIKEVIGKTVKSEILPGEQVLRDKLVKDKDTSDGLAYLVQPGKRAVTIAVNEVSGLAGQIMPGDRIDIMGTFDYQGVLTTLVLQNIPVLSVGQTTDAASVKGQDGKKVLPATTLTLMVAPEQMQPLVLCSENATIRLALRSAADQSTLSLPVTRISNLVNQ